MRTRWPVYMLRQAVSVALLFSCGGSLATETVVTINLKVLHEGTGSMVDTFAIRQGDIVENAVVNFTLANNLYDHHNAELLDAVRDVSLVHGRGLVPLPTLILAQPSGSPFSPPHTNAAGSLTTVLLEEAGALARDRPDNPLVASLYQVLYNQSRSSGTVPSNRVYALVGSEARFCPGVTPEELFLEYERQRFIHTGRFSGQFILVLGCGGKPACDVIIFGSSLLWDLEMPWEVPSASIVQALLASPAMYRAPRSLSRRLLSCDHMPLPVPPEELDVLVVVLTQGKDDPTTWGVFQDVATLLHEGLVRVGLRAALVQCGELRACGLPMVGPQWVLLAPHLLAYYVNHDDTPAVLTRRDLVPDNTVLYNFEHVPLPQSIRAVEVGLHGAGDMPPSTRGRSLLGADVLSVYQRFNVWDYSRSNVARLSLHNVSVSYVPVGFGESLHIPRPSGRDTPFDRRQIHVLFYGSVIPRRQRIIDQLRTAGLKVAFVTAANNGTFGEELDAYLLDTRVVLSLGAFDDDAEWKMTRFLKPLANRRLIIAENSSAEEQAQFEGGIVFVPTSKIVSACQYYLSNPEEAERVAEEGHRLFSQMREEDILKGLPLVESLLKAQQQREVEPT